jgi:hypothetical protein
MGPTDSCRLTDEEKEDAYRAARELIPGDAETRANAALFRAACLLLARIFGKEWFQANIVAEITSAKFVRRPLTRELDRMWYVTRAVELAEALYCLKAVAGIEQRIESCRLNTLVGESLELAWFEFFVPYLIQKKGHRIIEFVSPSAAKKTWDLTVEFHGHLLPVEVKAKLEGTPYSRRSLSNSLRLAALHLPERGPGVAFIMIHSHWFLSADFQRRAIGILQDTLSRHRNCNAVYVLCPLTEKLPSGVLAYPWRARCVANPTAFEQVDEIQQLVDERSDMPHEGSRFTFLEGAL